MGWLWTREEMIRFCKWSAAYSGYCGYHNFTSQSTVLNDSRC